MKKWGKFSRREGGSVTGCYRLDVFNHEKVACLFYEFQACPPEGHTV